MQSAYIYNPGLNFWSVQKGILLKPSLITITLSNNSQNRAMCGTKLFRPNESET